MWAEAKLSADLRPHCRSIRERTVRPQPITDIVKAANLERQARSQAILGIVSGMAAEICEVIALLGHLVTAGSLGDSKIAVAV